MWLDPSLGRPDVYDLRDVGGLGDVVSTPCRQGGDLGGGVEAMSLFVDVMFFTLYFSSGLQSLFLH